MYVAIVNIVEKGLSYPLPSFFTFIKLIIHTHKHTGDMAIIIPNTKAWFNNIQVTMKHLCYCKNTHADLISHDMESIEKTWLFNKDIAHI